MRAMEDRIIALEGEVRALKSAAAAAPAAEPSPPAQEPPLAPTRLGGAGGAAAKALNPDISVIGDFWGGRLGAHPRSTPALEMHESELGLQEGKSTLCARDFFISFGEHGVDLEEGLPHLHHASRRLRCCEAGKMRGAFGKVNTLHNHVLAWTDRPLVTQNILGGEEGISDAGVSLSRILPVPKGLFLEGTAQLFRGDSEGVFASHAPQRGFHGRAICAPTAICPSPRIWTLGASVFARP